MIQSVLTNLMIPSTIGVNSFTVNAISASYFWNSLADAISSRVASRETASLQIFKFHLLAHTYTYLSSLAETLLPRASCSSFELDRLYITDKDLSCRPYPKSNDVTLLTHSCTVHFEFASINGFEFITVKSFVSEILLLEIYWKKTFFSRRFRILYSIFSRKKSQSN